MRAAFASWPAVVAVTLVPAIARGQTDSSTAIGEALFRSGRELLSAGNYAEACPKFAESERVEPKPGTLMNLALCHEKIGKTASAWAEYVNAAEMAHRAGEPLRERVAREHAASLEPTLAHVLIQTDPNSEAQVVLDDRPLGPAAFGTAIPIDPGDHVLHATAPGKKPFSQSFSAAGREPLTLRIPPLQPVAPVVVPVASAPKAAARARPAAPEVSHADGSGAASRRIAGFALGGTGLALGGVGAFFGMRAFADKHTAESDCGAMYCTQPGLDAIHDMKTSEALSTASIAVGIAAFAAGVVLVVSGRPPDDSRHASMWHLEPDVGVRGARVVANW